MKKCFAIFCAVTLAPMFSAQAWIGGPFSQNSYSQNGDNDGVYEAFATARNGIGVYRIIVGNEFVGVNPTGVTDSNTLFIQPFPGTPNLQSGNIVIGSFNGATNVWFYEGVMYFGTTIGTANTALSIVTGTARAVEAGPGTAILESTFKAKFDRKTRKLVPVSGFTGTGRGRFSNTTTVNRDRFNFSVIGTKVSDNILFGL